MKGNKKELLKLRIVITFLAAIFMASIYGLLYITINGFIPLFGYKYGIILGTITITLYCADEVIGFIENNGSVKNDGKND